LDSTKRSRKKWLLENPEAREDEKITNRLRKVGITAEKALEVAQKQGGVCAICGGNKPLCFDHDHATGFFRGFLCNNCNRNLAHLENTSWRAAAEEYLRFPPALGVL
jgi:hypothetical protein